MVLNLDHLNHGWSIQNRDCSEILFSQSVVECPDDIHHCIGLSTNLLNDIHLSITHEYSPPQWHPPA